MVNREAITRIFIGRDVIIAYVVIVGLYLVRFVDFQPLQIPAYLLIVAYDFVEVVIPVLTPYHPIIFPVFLYFLAITGAGITRVVGATDTGGAGWIRTIGGVCLIVGVLSLGFGAFVGGPLVSATDNPTPLAITGTTGILFLGVGWLLLGRPTGVPHRTQS